MPGLKSEFGKRGGIYYGVHRIDLVRFDLAHKEWVGGQRLKGVIVLMKPIRKGTCKLNGRHSVDEDHKEVESED